MKNVKNILYLLLLLLVTHCKKNDQPVLPQNPHPNDTIPNDTIPNNSDTEKVFTLLFIGDSEPRMRGNTDNELKHYVQKLIELKSTKQLFFDYNGGNYRINPEVVILAGDISTDRGTSMRNDSAIWTPLFQNNILFLIGFGNHDWDPYMWGDSTLGYSFAGHTANEDTKALCLWSYTNSKKISSDFSYTAVEHLKPIPINSNGGPRNFYATYKGVGIVNFNTFLYQPSYYFPPGWPYTCNIFTGGAGCETFVSAEQQITQMENLLPKDTNNVMLFFQHYPISTNDYWWDDYNASHTTVTQKRERLEAIVSKYNKSVFLAGHNHWYAANELHYNNKIIKEYTAPYFGGNNDDDYNSGGGFLALLISNKRGILEVKRIDPPL